MPLDRGEWVVFGEQGQRPVYLYSKQKEEDKYSGQQTGSQEPFLKDIVSSDEDTEAQTVRDSLITQLVNGKTTSNPHETVSSRLNPLESIYYFCTSLQCPF